MAGPARPETEAPAPTPFEAVGRLVQSVDPHAVRCRIVWETEDGEEGSIPVPLRGAATDEMQAAVLDVLGRLKPGEWMGGKALAGECDTTRDAGNFRRAVAALRDANRIEANRNRGYRMRL
jgi:hypothetical protein